MPDGPSPQSIHRRLPADHSTAVLTRALLLFAFRSASTDRGDFQRENAVEGLTPRCEVILTSLLALRLWRGCDHARGAITIKHQSTSLAPESRVYSLPTGSSEGPPGLQGRTMVTLACESNPADHPGCSERPTPPTGAPLQKRGTLPEPRPPLGGPLRRSEQDRRRLPLAIPGRNTH